MERHTEIEHVLRPALAWDCMEYKVVIPFGHFGINNRSHLQCSNVQEEHVLIAVSLHI